MIGVLAGAIALVLWRLDINIVRHAFELVTWRWVVIAVLLNLASIIVRSIAWEIVIDEAVQPPCPRSRDVFAAFSVGLLGNAALPGRVGEVARIVVLTRRMRGRPGLWATLTGTVFAHRLFDVVAASTLVIYVVYAAKIPQWARPALAIALGVGFGLLIMSLIIARRTPRGGVDDVGPVRRVLRLARYGLTVMKRPVPAIAALCFQLVGWTTQLLAVWTMFYAFGIDGTITMAALVLVIMNLVMVFPLWPGNVGLRPGRDRALTAPVRGQLRPRLRLRDRPSGRRGLGRRRSRASSSLRARASRSRCSAGCPRSPTSKWTSASSESPSGYIGGRSYGSFETVVVVRRVP